jgi:hypothetical protein
MKLTKRLQELVDQIDYTYGAGTSASTGITATVHQRGEEFVVIHRRPDGTQYGTPDVLGNYVDAWRYLAEEREAPDRYQIGDLTHFRTDDPVVDSLNMALECALDMSGIDSDPSAVGIWSSQDEGSELLFIAFGGELFKKC